MSAKKKSIKATPKAMTVVAPARIKKARSTQKESVLSDKEFEKQLKAYMKDKESLMKKLSKR